MQALLEEGKILNEEESQELERWLKVPELTTIFQYHAKAFKNYETYQLIKLYLFEFNGICNGVEPAVEQGYEYDTGNIVDAVELFFYFLYKHLLGFYPGPAPPYSVLKDYVKPIRSSQEQVLLTLGSRGYKVKKVRNRAGWDIDRLDNRSKMRMHEEKYLEEKAAANVTQPYAPYKPVSLLQNQPTPKRTISATKEQARRETTEQPASVFARHEQRDAREKSRLARRIQRNIRSRSQTGASLALAPLAEAEEEWETEPEDYAETGFGPESIAEEPSSQDESGSESGSGSGFETISDESSNWETESQRDEVATSEAAPQDPTSLQESQTEDQNQEEEEPPDLTDQILQTPDSKDRTTISQMLSINSQVAALGGGRAPRQYRERPSRSPYTGGRPTVQVRPRAFRKLRFRSAQKPQPTVNLVRGGLTAKKTLIWPPPQYFTHDK